MSLGAPQRDVIPQSLKGQRGSLSTLGEVTTLSLVPDSMLGKGRWASGATDFSWNTPNSPLLNRQNLGSESCSTWSSSLRKTRAGSGVWNPLLSTLICSVAQSSALGHHLWVFGLSYPLLLWQKSGRWEATNQMNSEIQKKTVYLQWCWPSGIPCRAECWTWWGITLYTSLGSLSPINGIHTHLDILSTLHASRYFIGFPHYCSLCWRPVA